MTTVTITHKIESLNGDNYMTWRRQIKWILEDQDLWPFVNGEAEELEPVGQSKRII